ncbi:hypothetical protein GLE_5371 [Lysobacter enzymogenes]|uniref:Uncharacterized protein n=1 Tax=Lysobacter enzymogenes TaxID=69 RepID=A0A0S2DRA2_LYSEN|nr:hypothetical protein [Lysobacter enzymogenes]ALN60712.1 hypothetical protein GLE_5371 [Lysobacter enzymogenes]QCW24308.1 hypothetical protein FE772_00140 [Lysobacter enzymogenes]
MSTLRSLTLGAGLALAAGAVYLLYPPAAGSAIPKAEAPTPFELAPPVVEDIVITPTPQSSAGDAVLQLQYARGQDLPAQIPFNVGDKTVTLQRDDKDPQLYRAAIPFDFDGFVDEQTERQRQAGQQLTVPSFTGREFFGEAPVAFLDPAKLREQIATLQPIRIPFPVVFGPSAPVRPERSLLITDPRVVEDPTRTFDVCTGAGNPNGAWTFKTLMTNMANQPVSGISPSTFVKNWLTNWSAGGVINTFPVPARPQINSQILALWPTVASTGELDLNKSPFRLIAIVNRMDLRSNGGYGGGDAGEGRFIFGMVRRNANGTCTTLPGLVIAEYAQQARGCPAVRSLARRWGALGSMSLGSPAYNSALQALTDGFTAANAAPSKPNRSAINQVRSNEFLQNPWMLEEFRLPRGGGQLAMTLAKLTPHHSLNNTALLGNYINANAAAIVAGTYDIPLSYLGQPMATGSVRNISPQQAWNAPGVGNNLRNTFSLNTCDACHGRETQDTSFMHVSTRNSGAQAVLSRFLVGNGTLAAPSNFTMPDPVSGTPRTYGDLLRRQSDLSALQNNLCLSGAVFEEAIRAPLLATH